MMSKVEENVLISKEEYETLLEKVNAANTPLTNQMEDSGDKEIIDEQNMTTSSPSDKAQEGKDTSKTVKISNESSHSKSEDKEEEKENEEEDQQEEEVSVERDLSENSSDENVTKLLEKVPSNLKESAGFLVNYIVENGQGILEWDKELRFIHLKETLPKTNFAKLIIYALEEEGKPPKGMTMFKRTLKSIGISNVKSWIFSQTGGTMSPYEADIDSKGGKRSLDTVDGTLDNNKKSKKGRKYAKLEKLSHKWLKW